MTRRARHLLRSLSWVAMLACLALGAAHAQPAPPADTDPRQENPAHDTWHATTFVRIGPALRIIRYWSKGDWMRAETLIGGHPIVTIVRDGDYVAFDALEGRGARIGRSPSAIAEDAKRERPFGNDFDELVAVGAEKVEDATRHGRSAEVWSRTDASGRRKLWVTADATRLPIRLEVFVRQGAEQIETDYADWARGLEIPDGFFEAPGNIRLEALDYEAYLEAATTRPVAPVLYPDLLHGAKSP